MCIFVTLTEMSLMQKFIQLPNISCVVTKGFPPFSNLSTVSLFEHCFVSSSMWFKQVFLSLWHLAGCTGSDSLIFSHSFPSESWGLRAWGLFGALGISDNLNCSSSSLRWKSVASGNHEVKWKNTLTDTLTDFSILLVRDPRLTILKPENSKYSLPLILTSVRHSRVWTQRNKPKQQKHLKKGVQRVQQRRKVRAREVFWCLEMRGEMKQCKTMDYSLFTG